MLTYIYYSSEVLGDNHVLVQHICCERCYRRARGGKKSQPVDGRKRISKLFKDRNVVVKEI